METHFLQEVTWKRQGIMGTRLLLRKFQLHIRRMFQNENHQPMELSPQGSGGDLSGQDAGPSCPDSAFAKKGWTA